MPYRRLPNTDNARLKALKQAMKSAIGVHPTKLPFSQTSLQKAKYFLPQFEQSIIQHKNSYDHQVDKNKEFLEHFRKSKLYISHFIQVLNFAIIRGEQPESVKEYYGLGDSKVPSLNTEQDIFLWGKKMIEGEQKRVGKGGSYLTNPTIGVVRVRYEQFKEAARRQKTLQDTTQRTLDKVTSLREDADTIIVNIWNEVEESFDEMSNGKKRSKAEDYGIIYVYRKNEVKELI